MLDYTLWQRFFFYLIVCTVEWTNNYLSKSSENNLHINIINLKSKLLGMSALKLFTVTNVQYHLSW